MITQDYIIAVLWILGGHAFSTSSKAIAELTGQGHLVEGRSGDFAQALLYLTWPLWILMNVLKRR